MVRYYKRRYFKPANRDKYSLETINVQTTTIDQWTQVPPTAETEQASYQFVVPVVKDTQLQGMRKVKHITITAASSVTSPVYYTLVYVPDGYVPQTMRFPAAGAAVEAYDASQFVMSTGVLDFDGGPLRITSPLSRNLNSGDAIYLILACRSGTTQFITLQLKYAITLQ